MPENDYGKNSFFDNADTRRVYRFDAQTELLEAVQIYLVRPSGEVLIFDLDQIDYNQPIDPGCLATRIAGGCELEPRNRRSCPTTKNMPP